MNSKILSVIIPIFNVENYLKEALESVVKQDIGFEENIQLILVNDGSPDNSDAICKEYKKRFPKNITYIAQENQGVSAARNRGLEVAEGKYIAFFDPDDVLSLDAYRKVVAFFEDHYDEIDIAAFKMKFFERFTGDHPLNYRFGETKVIDVREHPTYMQSSGVSCVFKAKTLLKRRFDTKVKYAEDMKLINDIILEKMAYGVVDGPVYYVRKRMDEKSASNTGHLNPDYYKVTPKSVFKYVFDRWEKKNGKLDEFIQFVVLFDIQWRINQKQQIALTNTEETQYKEALYDLVRRVTNDELILRMPKMRPAFKIFLLRKKYGETAFQKMLSVSEGKVYFNGLDLNAIFGYAILPNVGIDRITPKKDGRLKIEGHISGLLTTGAKYWFETNRGKFPITKNTYRTVKSGNVFLGETADINEAFSVVVNLDKTDYVRVRYANNGEATLTLKTGILSKVGNMPGAFVNLDGLTIEKKAKGLKVSSKNLLRSLYLEAKFCLVILSKLKLRVARTELSYAIHQKLSNGLLSKKQKVFSLLRPFLIPLKALVFNIGTILLRVAARIGKRLKRKEIWLISDRIGEAGDSGEAFYGYLQKNHTDIDYYFAINKASKAYKRLQGKDYNVVNMLGLRYKYLILIADKVISSNADELIVNPFLDRWDRYSDITKFKFVFLQHGITKDDLSAQYNRWNAGFDLFITAAQKEYDSIVGNKGYGFGRDVVKLTGLPRYDALKDNRQNKIVFVPTWRKGLDGGLDKKTGNRMYSPDFKETMYYKFYNGAINDKRLIAALKKHGMVGEFYIHPSFGAQADDFNENETVSIQKMPYNFPKIFSEGSLLVTDYSSVAFDFATLRKPLIYAQFDKKAFFAGHTYKEGYFSYAKHGFGPVVSDHDALVNSIIEYIERDFAMEPKYDKRVDAFFKFNDKNNSKRVYEAIKSMSR